MHGRRLQVRRHYTPPLTLSLSLSLSLSLTLSLSLSLTTGPDW